MANGNNQRLKAFVRFDGSGRVVAGSLILRRKKPKVGKWVEIQAYECCNPSTTTTTTTSLTTTTTTSNPGYYTWTVYIGEGEGGACAQTTPTTVYTAGPDLTGSVVYTDTALTTTLIPGTNLAVITGAGKFVYTINVNNEAASPTAC